jgi:cell wall-associated NlpC family hydrolase
LSAAQFNMPGNTGGDIARSGNQPATSVLNFANSEIGKPYSEAANARLGPNSFDCSGLVDQDLAKVGVNFPSSGTTTGPEANYLSTQPGWSTVHSQSQVKAGDVEFFGAGAPDSGADASKFGAVGHTGIADSNTQTTSAYGTKQGVDQQPTSSEGGFVVGFQPPA